MMDANDITCRLARVEEIIALRAGVLRAGEEVVKMDFEGDGLPPPETWHFGAFLADGRIVGCVTLLTSSFEGDVAFQLRGMAVAEEVRGAGVGTQLLMAAERIVRADARVGAWRWWCNARKIAVPFYVRNGWRVVSEEFVIGKYGPHRRMVKEMRGA